MRPFKLGGGHDHDEDAGDVELTEYGRQGMTKETSSCGGMRRETVVVERRLQNWNAGSEVQRHRIRFVTDPVENDVCMSVNTEIVA